MLKKRRILKTPAIAKKRRRIFWIKTCGFIGAVTFFIFGLSVASGSDAFTIQTIDVQGSKATDSAEILSMVWGAMEGKHFHLFSKRNIFLYPKDSIEKILLKEFDRLSEASVTREGFRAIAVWVKEENPQYLWCGEKYQGSRENSSRVEKCSFLDEEGHLIGLAPEFNGSVYIRFYGPLSEDVLQASSSLANASSSPPDSKEKEPRFLNKQLLKNILYLVSELENIGIATQAVVYSKEEGISLMSEYGWEVRFLPAQDIHTVFKNLKATLGASVFQGEVGRLKLDSLQYLDLRYGNRVYYR